MNTPVTYFERLYEREDPWGYRDRWYEHRKRQILLSALPAAKFSDGWEIGCSNGESTAGLASRCERLLATDQSATAVRLARARTSGLANVRVQQATHPGDWPEGSFDLIVFSEVGYFMDAASLHETAVKIAGSLAPLGTVIACHWLRPFKEAALPGADVHLRLTGSLQLPRALRYEDQDFLLEAWTADPASVAERERLT